MAVWPTVRPATGPAPAANSPCIAAIAARSRNSRLAFAWSLSLSAIVAASPGDLPE